jgi:NADPH:quinone reductase-like Zn-dependent oxidoreductase
MTVSAASPPEPTPTYAQTMTAARVHRYGPPTVITVERIDVPEPRDQEVLLRVHAAGVGPWDALVRTGASGLPQSLPLTLGSEVSGVVERVGANVTDFHRGDEVFGATNASFVDGYAEYAVAAVKMITSKPSNLSHIEAASVPVVAVTAWQMLFDHARVSEGQTVFVHGGAGNVGAYAVQLARWRKVHVIASVRGNDADYVRALGADEVIRTPSSRLADFAGWADAVIDTVGGPAQDQLFSLAKPGGIVVSVVSPPNARRAQQYRLRSDYFIVDVNSALLARLADMLGATELVTSVGTVLPIAEARAAHEMLAGERPHERGKIVLRIDA